MGMVQMKGFTLVVDYAEHDQIYQNKGPWNKNILQHVCMTHLVIRCPETPPNIFVVEHLDLEAEIFLQVLDDHN